jgi:hypothetical protein
LGGKRTARTQPKECSLLHSRHLPSKWLAMARLGVALHPRHPPLTFERCARWLKKPRRTTRRCFTPTRHVFPRDQARNVQPGRPLARLSRRLGKLAGPPFHVAARAKWPPRPSILSDCKRHVGESSLLLPCTELPRQRLPERYSGLNIFPSGAVPRPNFPDHESMPCVQVFGRAQTMGRRPPGGSRGLASFPPMHMSLPPLPGALSRRIHGCILMHAK